MEEPYFYATICDLFLARKLFNCRGRGCPLHCADGVNIYRTQPRFLTTLEPSWTLGVSKPRALGIASFNPSFQRIRVQRESSRLGSDTVRIERRGGSSRYGLGFSAPAQTRQEANGNMTYILQRSKDLQSFSDI